MCDLLGSLEGKLEVFRCRTLPGLDSLGRRHPIKRVIDLNAVKLAGIIVKELLVGEAFGIEPWPPFLIAEARGPKPDCRHSGIITHPLQKTAMNIGLNDAGIQNFAKNGGFFCFFVETFSTATQVSGIGASCYNR